MLAATDAAVAGPVPPPSRAGSMPAARRAIWPRNSRLISARPNFSRAALEKSSHDLAAPPEVVLMARGSGPVTGRGTCSHSPWTRAAMATLATTSPIDRLKPPVLEVQEYLRLLGAVL